MFFYIESRYFIAYTLFISALIITIRTDLEKMLISRFTTICIIPLAFIFSLLKILPINLYQVLSGIVLGYLSLWLTNKIFYILRNKNGIGQGDFELMATIGAFTGPAGVWFSITIGSFLGALTGLMLLIRSKITGTSKIPFGPFLALGAIIYLFFYKFI